MNERHPHGLLRAFDDRYVGSFAGLSYDLSPGAVGVDPAILEETPDLEGRRVLVSHGHGRSLPLDKRPSFVVVALSRLMHDARAIASEGGIVFSSFELDEPEAAPLISHLGVGDTIYINASLSRLPEVALKRPNFAC